LNKKIRVILAISLLLIAGYSWHWASSTDTKEQRVYLLDDSVEKIAQAKGINLIRVNYQTNLVYRGIGDKMRSAEDPDNFFVLMESFCDSNKTITMSINRNGDHVYKEYWADPCPGVVSLLYTYDGGGYDFKEMQDEDSRIIFEKPMPMENYAIALVVTLIFVFVLIYK
jgi:hypothetical protein